MKKRSSTLIVFILLLLWPHSDLFSQDFKRIVAGAQDYLNLWQPGNELYEQSSGNNRTSNIFCSYVMATVYSRSRFAIKVGPSFKRIGYTIEDRIVTYTQTYTSPGNPPVTETYYQPTDFKARALNLGLMIVLEYRIPVKPLMYAGLNIDGYCLEFYKAGFIDPKTVQGTSGLVPKVYPPKDRFLWSNSTVSVFYLYSLVNKPSFSLSAKANLGMNVYSAWDQFSKYAFLGLGLEVGFGDIGIKDKGNLNK